MIEITNILVQTSLNIIIQLKKLIHQIRDAKYNPKTCLAICWNHPKIGGSCLLVKNGRMICHGAKSMKDTRIIARQYVRLTQKASYAVRLSPTHLVTASALADIGELIDLGIARKYIPLSSWELEIFNALVFKRGRVHFAVFSSGKVITGLTRLSLKRTIVLPALLEIAIL